MSGRPRRPPFAARPGIARLSGHLAGLALATWSVAAGAAPPDLLLLEEVREDQATIHVGASRYYLDRGSIASGAVGPVAYHTARTVMTRPGQPASVDEIAVVCDHPTLGLAVSIRRIGTANGNTVDYTFDQGPVTSLHDFDLTRLGERGKPVTVFSKVAQAVCGITATGRSSGTR